MQLVTVRFTTKKLSSVFDAVGNKIRDIVEEIPQCVTGIPRSTAEGYRKFGNWSIEPYFYEPDHKSGYRKGGMKAGEMSVVMSSRRAGKSVASKVAAAAAAGDYAAAINALGADNE